MKKQINPSVKAHLLRGALILLSLVTFNQDIFGGTTPTPTPTPTPSATCAIPTPGACIFYEAESSNNTLGGSAFIEDCPTCSGGEKVSFVGNNSGTLQFNGVGVAVPGNHTVTICYLNGDAVRYALLSVNGGQGVPVSFPSTGSFETVGSVQVTVILNTGCNTLEFYNPIVGDYAPDFDRIQFNCPTCTVASPTPTPTPTLTPVPTQTPTPIPTPDGCYPNFTTAEGCNALNSLTTGAGNTGLGWRALFADTIGNFNTGVGAGTLALNNTDSNTSVGAAALLLNISGTQNTAVGTDALAFNGSSDFDSATGSADSNTATGYFALMNNITGSSNTAIGWETLTANINGVENVAFGNLALESNVDGENNTALGNLALDLADHGGGNTAVGTGAGDNITGGNENVCVGTSSGTAIATGTNIITIGPVTGVHSVFGQEDNTAYVANILGARVNMNAAQPLYVDADGRLGTVPAAPTPAGPEPRLPGPATPKANPDAQAMLNLEVQKLEATISQQQNQVDVLIAQIKEQTAQVQKVNARLEMNKPKMIVNKPEGVP